MTNKILFSYHQDPKEPTRVVTVARRVTTNEHGTFVEFGYAVCAPKRMRKLVDKYFDGTINTSMTPVGDPFCKRTGRLMAEGRLNSDRTKHVRKLAENQHPLDAVRQELASYDAEEFPKFMNRIFSVPFTTNA